MVPSSLCGPFRRSTAQSASVQSQVALISRSGLMSAPPHACYDSREGYLSAVTLIGRQLPATVSEAGPGLSKRAEFTRFPEQDLEDAVAGDLTGNMLQALDAVPLRDLEK
jgi:hypothetical protein